MAEYIEREKIREEYEKLTRSYVRNDPYIADWRFDEMIESLPAADVATVRHGRWLPFRVGFLTSIFECSECHRRIAFSSYKVRTFEMLNRRYPFCHCGAKMDLEDSQCDT